MLLESNEVNRIRLIAPGIWEPLRRILPRRFTWSRTRPRLTSSRTPRTSSVKREPHSPRFLLDARLRGQPHGRVGCTEQVVVGSLYDLEKEPVAKVLGIDVQEFAFADAIVENAEGAHPRQPIGRDFEPRFEVVVVVVGYRQEGDAGRARALHGGEYVVRRQGDLLIAGAAEGVDEARDAGLAAIRNVDGNPQRAVGAAQRAREEGAMGIGDLDRGLRPQAEDGLVE